MVSLATFGPRNPGSNPAGSVFISNQKLSYTQIIQACDRATLIVITVTESSLVGGHLSCSIDE